MPEQLGPPLTEGQYTLVAHPLRIRILHALATAELTAAQVADSLGESRGNVHYHIQKLHAGGLIQLVRTEPNGGILERYYRAATTRFRTPKPRSGSADRAKAVETWLERTPQEVEVLFETLEALLGAWERVGSHDAAHAETWKMTVRFETVEDADDENSDGENSDGEGTRNEAPPGIVR